MAQTLWGSMPLHLAAGRNKVKMAKILLDNGAILDQIDALGTPLCYAVEGSHKQRLLYLIKKGANINLKNWNGISPLYCAIKEKKPEILQLLIINGANIYEKSKTGLSPLHEAILENSIQIIPILMEYGVSLCAKDEEGNSPLELALKTRNIFALKTICN